MGDVTEEDESSKIKIKYDITLLGFKIYVNSMSALPQSCSRLQSVECSVKISLMMDSLRMENAPEEDQTTHLHNYLAELGI